MKKLYIAVFLFLLLGTGVYAANTLISSIVGNQQAT